VTLYRFSLDSGLFQFRVIIIKLDKLHIFFKESSPLSSSLRYAPMNISYCCTLSLGSHCSNSSLQYSPMCTTCYVFFFSFLYVRVSCVFFLSLRVCTSLFLLVMFFTFEIFFHQSLGIPVASYRHDLLFWGLNS
jgi:hypothetical protein